LAPYPPTSAAPAYNNPPPPAYPIVNGIATWRAPIRGEKQWQQWAQDLEDFSEATDDAANARIPYQSAV